MTYMTELNELSLAAGYEPGPEELSYLSSTDRNPFDEGGPIGFTVLEEEAPLEGLDELLAEHEWLTA